MSKKVSITLSIICVFIASFLLLPISFKNDDENTEVKPKANIDIEKIIIENLGTESFQKYTISDEYINAYSANTSIVINTKTGEVKNLNTIFKEEALANVENYELNKKYPKFIIEGVQNSNRQYSFSEKGLQISYSNHEIKPSIQEEISITLSCNHLYNLIDFDCQSTIDDDYNVYKLDPSKPTIALTFDDGPTSNTKIVVDALTDNKANATFFMLGSMMSSNPEMVKTVYNAGFEIASHTYSHKYLTKITQEQRIEELSKTNKIFNEITGDNIKLTRAPYGSITKQIRENLNTVFIQWSVDPQDWKIKDSQKISEHIINNVEDGDIVLLHDIHLTTGKATELLLPLLYAKGFQVVSVSQLAELRGVTLEPTEIYNKF